MAKYDIRTLFSVSVLPFKPFLQWIVTTAIPTASAIAKIMTLSADRRKKLLHMSISAGDPDTVLLEIGTEQVRQALCSPYQFMPSVMFGSESFSTCYFASEAASICFSAPDSFYIPC